MARRCARAAAGRPPLDERRALVSDPTRRPPFKSTKYVEITNALGVMQPEVLTDAKTTAAVVRAAWDRIDSILRD
jgi:hypothetical protein